MFKPATASRPSLGIQDIAPIDTTTPEARAALEQARRVLSDPRLRDILAVRTAIQSYLCSRLAADGFVHPPITMLSGCTDPLNHWTWPARLDYYGTDVSVTQSLILQKMLMVMLSGADRVFWASPNVRMESGVGGKDYKYVSEFMQVDFERRGATYENMLGYVDALMQGLYAHLAETCGDIVTGLRGASLPVLDAPLEIFDAREVRERQGLADDDAVERWGSRQTGGRPFLVTNLKREAYDCFDPETDRFLNYDVVVPPCGDNPHPVECLSGAERTRSLADLRVRMAELGYPMDYFAPFFTLFESMDTGGGRITCAGGGFGIERLTFALLGLEDIHRVYPFPRRAEAPMVI